MVSQRPDGRLDKLADSTVAKSLVKSAQLQNRGVKSLVPDALKKWLWSSQSFQAPLKTVAYSYRNSSVRQWPR